MGETSAETPEWGLSYTPLSEISTRAPRWLWTEREEDREYGRIPLGHVSLVAAREGAGKDLFASWLAARVTRGRLPGEFKGKPRRVSIVATEDSYRETIAPRLLAAGANIDLVSRLVVTTRNTGQERRLTLPDDLELFKRRSQRNGEALIILNPLVSMFSPGINVMTDGPAVREVLEALRDILERAGIAALGIAHFNKTSKGDGMWRIANARAFVEVSRAGFVIAEDPDKKGTMILSQPRNNLGRTDLPNLAFRKDGELWTMDDGSVQDVGKLKWVSQDYPVNADDALAGKGSGVSTETGSSVIIAYVQSQAGREVTAAEVAEATGESKDNVRQQLRRGVVRGLLVRTEAGKYKRA